MRKIDELRTLLGEISNKESPAYVKGAVALMKEYEAERNRDAVFKWADEVIGHSLGNPEFDENSDFFLRSALSAYDAKARMGDFRSYCIALEWNRPVDKKYYVPRMKVLEHHGIMQAFQDFEDDKLDLLVLNMPPRTGKSTISLFFLTFRAALYPEQSIIGSGHSTMLTQSFYNELLEIITSDEYRFSQIFTGVTLVNKNSEYSFTVAALAGDSGANSEQSAKSAVLAGWFEQKEIANVKIDENGILSWDAYEGATRYWLRLGEGAWEPNGLSADLNLLFAGSDRAFLQPANITLPHPHKGVAVRSDLEQAILLIYDLAGVEVPPKNEISYFDHLTCPPSPGA